MEYSYRGISLSEPDGLFLTHIDGTTPEQVINTTQGYGRDGAVITSRYMPQRIIELTLLLDGADEREYMISVFAQGGELICGDKKIEAVVQSISCPPHRRPLTADITLMCPSPYFEAQESETTVLSGNESKWEFDWEFFVGDEFVFEEILSVNSQSVTNNGDVAVGCIFTIHAVNDTAGIIIRNADTQEYMQFAPAQIAAGSTYYIDTRTGHKSCTYRPTEDMELIMDAPSLLTWGSTFLQAAPGVNRFYVTATGGCGGIEVSVVHTDLFSGV